jgi:hypothetical protein
VLVLAFIAVLVVVGSIAPLLFPEEHEVTDDEAPRR